MEMARATTDKPAARRNDIEVRRVNGLVGAEILGLDLGAGWDGQIFRAIHDAVVEYGVVFLRDQSWTVDQQLEFAKLFGPPAYSKKLPFYAGSYEYVSLLENDGSQQAVGDVWHTDNTDWEVPPMGAVLHCEVAPEFGGDTVWANTCAAYDLLPEKIKRMIDDMTAMHDNSLVAERYGGTAGVRSEGAVVGAAVEHPVVRHHALTGRPVLFVNSTYTRRIVGLEREQSDALLHMLFDQVKRPEIQVRFRWRPNSVAIWDNRCTQHYAVGDYIGQHRRMRRVQIEGVRGA